MNRRDLFINYEKLYPEMPDYLLRVQRRGLFRLSTPTINPIKCIIPIKPNSPDEPDKQAVMREVIIRDIGWEGVGLLCEEHGAEILKGKKFRDCRILLPGIGLLTVGLKVKSSTKFTTCDNVVQRHIGCTFIGLDERMNLMLQIYMSQLYRPILEKESPLNDSLLKQVD